MRVLYIKPCSWGSEDLCGDSRSLMDMIHSVKGEVEPIVLLPHRSKTYETFVRDGIRCVTHPFSDVFVGRFLFFPPWLTRIAKCLCYDIPCLLFLIRFIRKEHIDLVHTNSSATTLGWALQRITGIKHVWHIREYADPFHYHPIAIGRERLKRRINHADARIVCSFACKDFWGLKESGTRAILDAVRSVQDCCYVREKQPYILFCSHWVNEDKGAFAALRAFALSGLAGRGTRLRFVGNMSESVHNALISMAEEHSCADSVDCIPLQDDVKPLFSNAMAYLQPSVNEGMGRTTAEAMFYGCPVIAHASGGTLDLVEHGRTGWLFKTVEECAGLLETVCSTDQEQVIQRALEFARNELSVENYGGKLLSVYRTVLGK